MKNNNFPLFENDFLAALGSSFEIVFFALSDFVESELIEEGVLPKNPKRRIGISFNGGKDSVVVLHVSICIALAFIDVGDAFAVSGANNDRLKFFRKHRQYLSNVEGEYTTVTKFLLSSILIFYLEDHNELPEMKIFLRSVLGNFGFPELTLSEADGLRFCDERSNVTAVLPFVLTVRVAGSRSIRTGLELLCEHLGLHTVILGTRCEDPDGAYLPGPSAPSSNGWPEMIRVCPVFYWAYSQIWMYIFVSDLPFCELYSKGFTSIGDINTTRQNPHCLVGKERPVLNPLLCQCWTYWWSCGNAICPFEMNFFFLCTKKFCIRPTNRVKESSHDPLKKIEDGYYPAWFLSDGTKERDGRRPRSAQKVVSAL